MSHKEQKRGNSIPVNINTNNNQNYNINQSNNSDLIPNINNDNNSNSNNQININNNNNNDINTNSNINNDNNMDINNTEYYTKEQVQIIMNNFVNDPRNIGKFSLTIDDYIKLSVQSQINDIIKANNKNNEENMDLDVNKDKNWLENINNNRKNVGLGKISDVYCKVCKTTGKHFMRDCEKLVCKICGEKHLTRLCEKRPKICQYCGTDVNIKNYKEGKKPLHTNFFDCPKKSIYLAKKFARCIICKQPGHIALNCKFKNNNNFNRNKNFIKKNNNNNFNNSYNANWKNKNKK